MTVNRIYSIPSNYFREFKALRDINLSNNKLQVVPCLTPLQTSLQKLRLANNNIQNLNGIYTSRNLSSLEYIDLSRNKISAFDVTVFSRMPNLKRISLLQNKLQWIANFRHVYQNTIKLGANPWHCGPALSWMWSLTLEDRNILCVSPSCLRGNIITEMSNNWYQTESWLTKDMVCWTYKYLRNNTKSVSHIAI